MTHKLDRSGCRGNTIKVAAGHYVDLVATDPTSIEIRSIAAALSKICRFGGHCPIFYSVAEHCMHATALATADRIDKEARKAIFLHDAAEAYIGDMVRPLKVTMPQYNDAETRINRAISEAFNVDFEKHREVIKHYDRVMLMAEKRELWPEDTETWEGFDDVPEREVEFGFAEPREAETLFLMVANHFDLIPSGVDS